jgi:hypothetical protein
LRKCKCNKQFCSVQRLSYDIKGCFDSCLETNKPGCLNLLEFVFSNLRLVVLSFNTTDKDSWAIDIMNETLTFGYEQIRRGKKQNAVIRGAIIGVNRVEIMALLRDKEDPNIHPGDIPGSCRKINERVSKFYPYTNYRKVPL